MADTFRGLMVILDGLGDRPVVELEGSTPLEAAHTPNLDALAAGGMTGLMTALGQGVPVGTDVGVSALMGVPVPASLISRGPIEAAGVGLKLSPGDVALRCNFATVTGPPGNFQLIDRRAGRIREGTRELAEALNRDLESFEGIRAVVRPATSHRAVLHLSGPDLSERVSDPDPGAGWERHGVLECRGLDGDMRAERTARAVNHFMLRAHAILDDHPLNRALRRQGRLPANFLLPRKAGMLREVDSVVGALGVSAAAVGGECTVAGLARLLRMNFISEPGFTGDVETDLEGKVRAVAQALTRHDLVFLHIKGPDLLSHDGDPLGKRDLLARIDAALGTLAGIEDLVVAVTADHSTPCFTRRHSGDPVPVLLRAPLGRRDGVSRYGESACMGGALGHITANHLLWSLLDQMNVTHNFRPSELELLGLDP
jgi:2,3-bisphosphoglycerate-independent phosphoglycerate mutase